MTSFSNSRGNLGRVGSMAREDYAELVRRLEARFGRREPPVTVRRKLQDLKHETDETIEEFAGKAQQLAIHGFPDAPMHIIETVAADAFLQGCWEKYAALTVMNQNPQTVIMAVELVDAAMHNQNVLPGDRAKSKLRQVLRFEEPEDTPSVRQATIEPEDCYGQLSFEVAALKDGMNEIRKQLADLLKSRSPSPARQCFKCGPKRHFQADCNETGHLSRNCPTAEKIIAPVVNNSAVFIKLKAGQIMGQVEEVTFNQDAGEVRSTRVEVGLDPVQAKALRDLLIEFSSTFAQSDTDLGCIVKHRYWQKCSS
ncbi:hypothetical protein CAPTEDRAFT_200710 [Capitella teleta]|uniref:CCHC-type domain-containing protein n=1 Tax=Capitella teleta TaxID=283909 RepID=R7URT6_CAPTE|nr:hypothetical protein CAPTEDRAFT_200710 [Capitella teleta]|eukprot:ELU09234.1 hypothetical protein CAPTEDRAFT_200710 [Capitella teleta]